MSRDRAFPNLARTGPWLVPFLAMLALVAWPGRPADPLAQGQRIVATRCAACHGTAGHAPPRPGQAPDLAWVAQEHPAWLDGVFLRPPRPMLGVVIAPEDREPLRAWFAREGARQVAPSRSGSSDGLTADASAPGSWP